MQFPVHWYPLYPPSGRVERSEGRGNNRAEATRDYGKTVKQRKQKARHLRAGQTKSEGLLWSILRAKQVCGLKFRRQHPIGSYFADFACVSKKLVIEIDVAITIKRQNTILNASHLSGRKDGRFSDSATSTLKKMPNWSHLESPNTLA